MSHNRTTVGGRASTKEEDFEFYDVLPIELKCSLMEVAQNTLSLEMYRVFRQYGIDYAKMMLSNHKRLEIDRFDRYHYNKHGYKYPHAAANATIVRYYSAKRSRTGLIDDTMTVPNIGRRTRGKW